MHLTGAAVALGYGGPNALGSLAFSAILAWRFTQPIRKLRNGFVKLAALAHGGSISAANEQGGGPPWPPGFPSGRDGAEAASTPSNGPERPSDRPCYLDVEAASLAA